MGRGDFEKCIWKGKTMFKKLGLGIVLVLGIASFGLSYTVRVEPDKIVPNSIAGKADDLQVSVLISVPSVKDLVASISIAGGEEIDAVGYDYCAIDDVLHIYFNKDTVIQQILAANLDGEVVVSLAGSFWDGEKTVLIEGFDTIEVYSAPVKK